MSYQPIYGTMYDGIGERSTHSRRGTVQSIRYGLNSVFGEVMEIRTTTSGNLAGALSTRVYECRRRVQYWTELGKPKKVEEWNRKLIHAEETLKTEEKKEHVSTSINLEDNSKFCFDLNGVELNKENMEVLRQMKNKDIEKAVLFAIKKHKMAERL